MIHMKTEFNVGDMVRVKSKKELIDIFGVTQDGYITGNKGGWVKEMYDVCEKEGFVIIVNQKLELKSSFTMVTLGISVHLHWRRLEFQ